MSSISCVLVIEISRTVTVADDSLMLEVSYSKFKKTSRSENCIFDPDYELLSSATSKMFEKLFPK